MTAKKKGATPHGRIVEKRRKVKGFWTIEVWFQSEIVCVCVYKERRGRGGRESREENKSEERGEKEEKSGRRTFFAVKFSSMDEMNCTRDHK